MQSGEFPADRRGLSAQLARIANRKLVGTPCVPILSLSLIWCSSSRYRLVKNVKAPSAQAGPKGQTDLEVSLLHAAVASSTASVGERAAIAAAVEEESPLQLAGSSPHPAGLARLLLLYSSAGMCVNTDRHSAVEASLSACSGAGLLACMHCCKVGWRGLFSPLLGIYII